MSDFEYFTRLFDMMQINEIIFIFFIRKKIFTFLKAFCNSLTAKNHFVIKCDLQFLKKKNHPYKLLCDCSKMKKLSFLQTDF